MKVTLKDKTIPRNKSGDPAFERLGEKPEENVGDVSVSVLDVFSPQEVVELVNRCLYQLEYQSRSHAKRREEQAAIERPVKAMFKELYPHESFAKATPDQIKACLERLKR